MSDASVHDSQKFEDVLDTSNTASGVWAKRAKGSVKRSLMEWRAEGDSAYRSDDIEEKLAERGLKSRIHRRAYRGRAPRGVDEHSRDAGDLQFGSAFQRAVHFGQALTSLSGAFPGQ